MIIMTGHSIKLLPHHQHPYQGNLQIKFHQPLLLLLRLVFLGLEKRIVTCLTGLTQTNTDTNLTTYINGEISG